VITETVIEKELPDNREEVPYEPIPTLKLFHESPGQIRCVVGPVGSGKTSAATWEVCYLKPELLWRVYGIKKTRWCIVRNTFVELIDTTMVTVFDWFSFGQGSGPNSRNYTLRYPEGFEVEILFRSCDRPEDVKKFKSLEITGYWIDESIEVADEIKRMLKNRIGRYPKRCPVRYGIETTNPPDVEHSTYWQFDWQIPPPGPIPPKPPLKNHYGFWQPPHENDANLRPGYYADMMEDYRESPDWISMYIEGKPGMMIQGKLVYNNFKRDYHVAKEPLLWSGGPLYVGWDASGNTPAAVVMQIPGPNQAHILAEFYSESMGIVDFGKHVIKELNIRFPNHTEVIHWGDPAGEAKYSKREGGFTSNHQLLQENCHISVLSSEQNLKARIESVDQMLARINGVLIDPRCIRLINGFVGGYCYPENKSIVGEYLDNIIKNKYSHVHDALQYVMVKIFKPLQRPDAIPTRLKEDYDSAELFEQHDTLHWGL
jgi:hypothetical protein